MVYQTNRFCGLCLLLLSISHVVLNSASRAGGGMALLSSVGTVIYKTNVSYNAAPMGAGLGMVEGSSVLLQASTVQGNQATDRGGGVMVRLHRLHPHPS